MPSYNSSFLENYMQQQQQQQEQNNIKVVLASNNNNTHNNTSNNNNHLNVMIPPYSPRSKRSNSLSVNVDVMSPRRYRSASLSRPNIQLNNQSMTTKSIVVTGPPTNKRLDLRVHVHKRQQSLSAAQDIVMSGQLSPLPTPLSAIAAFTFDVSQIRPTTTTGASSVASTVNSVGSSTDMKTPHSAPALPHHHHHRRNFFSFDSAASSVITTTSVITPLSSSPSSPSTYFKSNKQMFNPKRRQSTVGQELDFVESSGAAVESEELNTSSIDLSLSDLSLQQPQQQQQQQPIIDYTQFTFDEDFEHHHHHHHAEDSHTDSVDSDHEAHEEPSASTSTGLSRPVSMPSLPLNENVIEFEQVKQLERRERVASPTDAARRYTMGAIRFSKRIEKQTTKSKPARFAKRVAKGVHDFFDSHTWILG